MSIAEADAAASTTFTYPHLTLAGSQQFATFQKTEAGNVAASRVMLTSTNSDLDHLGPWREPYPLAVAASSHAGRIWLLAMAATVTAPAVAWHLFRPKQAARPPARHSEANYQPLP
ncbi:MAG: hypothetical protein AB7J35_16860 [Dehalococcoidia bacterium]